VNWIHLAQDKEKMAVTWRENL